MKLLALLEDPEGPSARLRFHAFRPGLDQAGIQVTVAGLPRSGPGRWRLLRSAAKADLVFAQRRLLPAWEVRLLRRHARWLLYDLDDALYLRDRPPYTSRTRAWKFRAWVRAADRVLVGNPVLEKAVRERGGRPVMLPTTVPAGGEQGAPARHLIWIGQASTTRYLVDLMQGLAPWMAQEGLRLDAVGADPHTIPSSWTWLRALPWSPREEGRVLASGGVGLAPLTEDPWTAGKCGLRLLRYLAHGLRAVASPVGFQATLAAGCPAVLLPRHAAEWPGAVGRQLAAGPGELRDMQAAALQRAAEYEPGVWAERFLEAIRPEST